MMLGCMFTLMSYCNFIPVITSMLKKKGYTYDALIIIIIYYFFWISYQGDARRATDRIFPYPYSIKAATAHNFTVHVTVASALMADVALRIGLTLPQSPSAAQGATCSTELS